MTTAESILLTELLRRDHELVDQALDVLRAVADRMDDPSPPAAAARTLVDFFRDFTDGVHHYAEESLLFPALERAGMGPAGGPVGCMLGEHEEGRTLVGQMLEALAEGLDKEESRKSFRQAAQGFAILLGQHIFKENHILFEMAERMIPPAELAELAGEYMNRHHEALNLHAGNILALARTFVGSELSGEQREEGFRHHIR